MGSGQTLWALGAAAAAWWVRRVALMSPSPQDFCRPGAAGGSGGGSSPASSSGPGRTSCVSVCPLSLAIWDGVTEMSQRSREETQIWVCPGLVGIQGPTVGPD